MRLVLACPLSDGRKRVSNIVARLFHLVLAVTSQNLTALNSAAGRRSDFVGSVGRSAQLQDATAMSSAQVAVQCVLIFGPSM
jgi:hypothetical protein